MPTAEIQTYAPWVQWFVSLASFSGLCVLSQAVSSSDVVKRLRVPLITAYMLVSIVTGPHILGYITTDMLQMVTFVPDACIVYIAFAAGSEMYMPLIYPLRGAIFKITMAQVLFVVGLAPPIMVALSASLNFLGGNLTTGQKWSIALVSAVIMSARSPSSAIAIVSEIGARGRFTQTALGVTIIRDVVVILFFAVAEELTSSSFAASHDGGGAGGDASFLLVLLAEMAASVVAGLLLACVLYVLVMWDGEGMADVFEGLHGWARVVNPLSWVRSKGCLTRCWRRCVGGIERKRNRGTRRPVAGIGGPRSGDGSGSDVDSEVEGGGDGAAASASTRLAGIGGPRAHRSSSRASRRRNSAGSASGGHAGEGGAGDAKRRGVRFRGASFEREPRQGDVDRALAAGSDGDDSAVSDVDSWAEAWLDNRDLVRGVLVCYAGYGVLRLSDWSHHAYEFGLETLMTCMVAAFALINKSTAARHRLEAALLSVQSLVYLCFFSYTGMAMNVSILPGVLGVALLLYAIRMVTTAMGSAAGGFWAGDPSLFNKVSWMTYVTQAGVALALLGRISTRFGALPEGEREWVDLFVTAHVAVVVLAQLTGPPLFKWSVTRVGEAGKASSHRAAAERASAEATERRIQDASSKPRGSVDFGDDVVVFANAQFTVGRSISMDPNALVAAARRRPSVRPEPERPQLLRHLIAQPTMVRNPSFALELRQLATGHEVQVLPPMPAQRSVAEVFADGEADAMAAAGASGAGLDGGGGGGGGGGDELDALGSVVDIELGDAGGGVVGSADGGDDIDEVATAPLVSRGSVGSADDTAPVAVASRGSRSYSAASPRSRSGSASSAARPTADADGVPFVPGTYIRDTRSASVSELPASRRRSSVGSRGSGGGAAAAAWAGPGEGEAGASSTASVESAAARAAEEALSLTEEERASVVENPLVGTK